MAPVVESFGTTAQTQGGAESTVVSWSTAKTRVVVVDLQLLADGESCALRVYNKAASGGSEILAYEATYLNSVYEDCVLSPPVPIGYAGSFRVIQYAGGSNRAFPYHILTLD